MHALFLQTISLISLICKQKKWGDLRLYAHHHNAFVAGATFKVKFRMGNRPRPSINLHCSGHKAHPTVLDGKSCLARIRRARARPTKHGCAGYRPFITTLAKRIQTLSASRDNQRPFIRTEQICVQINHFIMFREREGVYLVCHGESKNVLVFHKSAVINAQSSQAVPRLKHE